MKMLFASDSFKGSLTAVEICDLLQEAAADIFPDAETVSLPIADGGEGTVDALLCAMGGKRMTTRVTGPLLMPVDAQWGLLGDGQTAVLEMAQASGLPYVPAAQRDPRKTTSYGTGELIAEAVRCGAKSLLIGIGGSATNDGGLGMLSALGAVFTDRQGKPVPPTGGALADVCHADFSGLMPELADCRITVLCDVTNPLLGATGATYTYGPQKGATPEICAELEAGMKHYVQVVENTIGRGIADFPGAGAAGGLGAAPAAQTGEFGCDGRGQNRRTERAVWQSADWRGTAVREGECAGAVHLRRYRRRRGRAVRRLRKHDSDDGIKTHGAVRSD